MSAATYRIGWQAQFGQSRARRLGDELAFALGRTDRATLKSWGVRAGGRTILLGARRVRGLLSLLAVLARFGGREAVGLVNAVRRDAFGAHIGERAAAAIDNGIDIGREGRRQLAALIRALVKDPARTATALLALLLGFEAGSGGLDGNGGVADLDLLVGIGHHRSPITHTIIAGILLEALILALLDLSGEIHERLPHDHDPLWDRLAQAGRPLAESLAMGLSFGLAYHLFVDALVQPAPYHDLPFSMPMEVHQTVMAANAATEANDAAGRRQKDGVVIEQPVAPRSSTGQRVVAGFVGAMRQGGVGLRRLALRVGRSTTGRRAA